MGKKKKKKLECNRRPVELHLLLCADSGGSILQMWGEEIFHVEVSAFEFPGVKCGRVEAKITTQVTPDPNILRNLCEHI